MINEELVKYVRQQLEKERTSEEIREDLKKSGGWSDSDINEVFDSIYGKKRKTINSKTALLVGAFFVVGLGGYLLGRASVSEEQLPKEQVQQQEEVFEDDIVEDEVFDGEISKNEQESIIEAEAFIITLPKKFDELQKSDEFAELAKKYGNQFISGCTI